MVLDACVHHVTWHHALLLLLVHYYTCLPVELCIGRGHIRAKFIVTISQSVYSTQTCYMMCKFGSKLRQSKPHLQHVTWWMPDTNCHGQLDFCDTQHANLQVGRGSRARLISKRGFFDAHTVSKTGFWGVHLVRNIWWWCAQLTSMKRGYLQCYRGLVKVS